MIKHAYGHKAPKTPHKHLALKRLTAPAVPLPPVVSLRPICSPVIDQSTAGSCTGCASKSGIELLSQRAINDGVWNGPLFMASALGIYACERIADSTLDQDAGASIADAAAALERGVIPDADWPYDLSMLFVAPTVTAMADSLRVKLVDATAIDNDHDTIRGCLAQGFPILIGVSVYDSFEAAFQQGEHGDVPMPNTSTESLLGGHALLLVGYDDNKKQYTFKNSWGDAVGDGGYGTFPYAFIEDSTLTSELYELRRIAQFPDASPPATVPPAAIPPAAPADPMATV